MEVPDGVFICMDDTEAKEAFKNILSSPKSLFGKKNVEVLVQSYLHGTEYIVNTVSCNGFHYVTDIWEYKKRLINGKPIYDRELLLSSNGSIQSMLIPYVFNVLDALDIKYGAAHHEVMLTKDGPVLVEVGARVGGNVVPQLHSEILHHNQAELSIYSYLSPKLFKEYTSKPYTIKKNMMHILMSTDSAGTIEEIPLANQVKELQSYKYLLLAVKKGDCLVPTYDLLSKPGDLWLAHKSLKTIERDYLTFINDILPSGFLIKK